MIWAGSDLKVSYGYEQNCSLLLNRGLFGQSGKCSGTILDNLYGASLYIGSWGRNLAAVEMNHTRTLGCSVFSAQRYSLSMSEIILNFWNNSLDLESILAQAKVTFHIDT